MIKPREMREKDRIGEIISLIFTAKRMFSGLDGVGKSKKSLSFVQFVLLRFIKEKSPQMKDIAGFLSVTPPSVTALVDHLIWLGMVKREISEEDRRVVCIAITKKGERYLEKTITESLQKMKKGLENLSVSEQEDLIRILEKMTKSEL